MEREKTLVILQNRIGEKTAALNRILEQYGKIG
jgi:hypothetical protein